MSSSKSNDRPSFMTDGSVVKITLKNFMTYKNENIYPGASFNVTVGPNGSGKSSIVTALSICLGGELKSLNRQLDLQSLINNDSGNEAAVIEIELYSSKTSNTVVKTIIKRGCTEPSWQINNKPVSKERLLSFTEKLKIQPNNLCQFLPQDVVREFPQMKPPEIFENTIKAVGDQEMLDKLYKGEEIQGIMENIANDLRTKKNTLSSLEQKEKKNEEVLRKIKKFEEFQERKDVLEKAMAWEKFSVIRKLAKETRDKKKNLDEKQQALKEELDSAKTFCDNYNSKTDAIKKDIESAEKDLAKIRPEIENFDINNLEDQIDHLDTQVKDLEHTEKDRLNKKKKTQDEIAQLKAFLEQNPPSTKDEEELKTWKEEKQKRHEQENMAQQYISEIEDNTKSLQTEVTRLKKREKELINIKSRKLSVLERENEDTYKGVLWLRRNKHRFKKTVYEPIMLCLDVKDSEYVKYVETHIGRSDLEGFICEDAEDMNLLLKELRENNRLKKINVFQSEPVDTDSFNKPRPADQLKEYGFRCYLSDMYEAPPAINAYLCQQKNLHQVPVFAEEIPGTTDKLKEMFRSYYIGYQRFNVKRSQYSGEISIGVEDISFKRAIRLADNIDKGLLEEVQKDIKDKEAIINSNAIRLKHREDTKLKLVANIKELNGKISKIELRKKEYKSKENEISFKEEVLKSLAKPKVDIEAQKKEIRGKKQKCVKDLWTKVSKNLTLIKEYGKLDLVRQAHQLQLRNVEGENQDSMYKIRELEKDYQTVSEQLQIINKTFDTQRKEIQDIHNAAKAATDGFQDDKTKYKPPIHWQNKFKEHSVPNDESTLKAMIEDCELDMKRLAIKPDTMKKINEVQEAYRRAKKETEDLEERRENKKRELDQLCRSWISGVKNLVSEVNDEFAKMMARLGYSGMVQLQEGLNDDPLDIKNYGIKIMVKFRSGEEFNELSKGTQSGGEKSVTTAVYMMALQGLTQVPFRCVDEINQGMDESNERMVWNMLLEVCRDHHAQYFYMAPKFPYNLPFDSQVTILLCNSGNTKKKKDSDFCTKKFREISRNI